MLASRAENNEEASRSSSILNIKVYTIFKEIEDERAPTTGEQGSINKTDAHHALSWRGKLIELSGFRFLGP